jgi:flagellar capping protein FliD
MSSVSSLGSAAGFDLNQILAAKERSVAARLNFYDQQATAYNSRLSGYAKVRASLDKLNDAASAIAKLGNFDPAKNSDPSPAASAVKQLVDAFNAVRGEIGAQSAVGKDNTVRGALAGDASLRAISTALQGALDNGDMGKLGLSFDNQGNLTLDSAKLEKALKDDPDAVRKLLQGDDKNGGLGKAIADVVTAVTKPGGYLDKAASQVKGDLRNLAGRQADEATRAVALMETYRIQYTRLDMLINNSNSANDFFSGQMAMLRGR